MTPDQTVQRPDNDSLNLAGEDIALQAIKLWPLQPRTCLSIFVPLNLIGTEIRNN